MASKKFTKDSEEFAFFGEFWKMVQEFYYPDQSDEYWDKLLLHAATCGRTYRKSLYKHLIQAFLDYAEEESKKR